MTFVSFILLFLAGGTVCFGSTGPHGGGDQLPHGVQQVLAIVEGLLHPLLDVPSLHVMPLPAPNSRAAAPLGWSCQTDTHRRVSGYVLA
ncbi:uncharacterized protein B0H18DRAFT_1058953 [Fomitopsis serialis]|uniref:uncharacterized protein n=1 Tax=Fomitopsis serialis TaxID=139415 RepID=UPI0020088A56|nr:uncharacterized protein B0H18DRAFT_1058953 [Neoantrodia serialis]KAH9911800.1 hypothetical protein B0H18DRAFT_1058953 [Neoantrodia serialis]